MKPQKKSIRDFFSPLSQTSANKLIISSQLSDSNSAPVSPPKPLTAKTPTESTKPHNPSAQPAQNTANATSPDAQPPPASQNSANSSTSKRIVSKGEQVVLNSDSDTDSLPDLDWGGPTIVVRTATSTVHSKRTSEDISDGLRRPVRKEKKAKRPIDQVIETVQKNREIERIVSEHKADLEKHVEEGPTLDFILDEEMLGQAVEDDDDPEKAHRLFFAMQRTNAIHVESVFHFFSGNCHTKNHIVFPIQSLPQQRWTSIFQDASARDQAFFTGYAHQMFRLQELPKELASWMIDEIVTNRYNALAEKYLEILEAHDHFLHTLIDHKRINHIFRSMGADVENLDSEAKLIRSFNSHTKLANPIPATLEASARLLEVAAPRLQTNARTYAFHMLCHTCVDNRVLNDPHILRTVQDAIEAIVCNFADNEKLMLCVNDTYLYDEAQFLTALQLNYTLPRLVSHFTNPKLQRDLVCALPAHSPLTAYLRRHLALSFLLCQHPVNMALADPGLPALIYNLLKSSPGFHVNRDTDYEFLTARLELLDVTIGPGLLSVPYQPLVNLPVTQAGSSLVTVPLPDPGEIKEFNRVVDALTQHIKLLGNSIIEASAAVDLTILEAKDGVERLCSRLEHAVRIGGKKSDNVFGGNGDQDRQLKVTDILRKVAKTQRPKINGGIFKNDEDTEDDMVVAQIQAESNQG
ncbi:hypothetical protein GQ44DRAFT_606366 [Phaeosphaeriaceae sp. PMI808]|nr:hypothetical protein GQ44DRAFT_606366 [Phaeosphaeriaceae sp. PMI808]